MRQVNIETVAPKRGADLSRQRQPATRDPFRRKGGYFFGIMAATTTAVVLSSIFHDLFYNCTSAGRELISTPEETSDARRFTGVFDFISAVDALRTSESVLAGRACGRDGRSSGRSCVEDEAAHINRSEGGPVPPAPVSAPSSTSISFPVSTTRTSTTGRHSSAPRDAGVESCIKP
ncbi:unnamed protein product, partial [Amoebophrya sp. A120]|eukprot:GSA120T00021919001.1